MTHFIRSLFVTLTTAALVLAFVLAVSFINEIISESGFSSGEVLVLNFEKGLFSGEALGKKFSADLSPVLNLIPVLEKYAIFLSPCSQLLIRLFFLFTNSFSSFF